VIKPSLPFKKKSMIASLQKEEKPLNSNMKRSSFYQYEMDHNAFNLPESMVIM
jgi:hypothetical protein